MCRWIRAFEQACLAPEFILPAAVAQLNKGAKGRRSKSLRPDPTYRAVTRQKNLVSEQAVDRDGPRTYLYASGGVLFAGDVERARRVPDQLGGGKI